MNKNIDLSQTTAIKCTCGSEHFKEVITLRKISRLLIAAEKDQIVNVPKLICIKCDEILDMENL